MQKIGYLNKFNLLLINSNTARAINFKFNQYIRKNKMEKLTEEQSIDIMDDIVRQHHENKRGYPGSHENDYFTFMAQHFCNIIVALTDSKTSSIREQQLSCIRLIMGDDVYSNKNIYNYSITVDQFSSLLGRLLKAYHSSNYWFEKKSEDKLALDAITTVLCNILKVRLLHDQKLINNISISFGEVHS